MAHSHALAAYSDASEANIHASCVALADVGLLIVGASGSGKSSLSLELMALGAKLVADDRVILKRKDDEVVASCPVALTGLIEARGLGLLRAESVASARVHFVLDLDLAEGERLPAFQQVQFLSCKLPLLARPKAPMLSAALLQLLKAGRAFPDRSTS